MSTTSTAAESKADAEALVPQFKLERVLNQDQNGRRISLLGSITSKPALMVLERASFPSDPNIVSTFLSTLTNATNLGANDIYRWYMANREVLPSSSSSSSSSGAPIPDLKLNLIYPCTTQHIQKYSPQRLRVVRETAAIYALHIRPYMLAQRSAGRLDWIFNILEGRTEQEDVILRSRWDSPDDEGFLLLPDLNWDRRSVEGLHLLALVQRRDLWSLRDLKKRHVPWLKDLRDRVVEAITSPATTSRLFSGSDQQISISPDELKCYVHYQPTYYHFHIHVVHVMLEASGPTQSVGKAVGLASLISLLENLPESSKAVTSGEAKEEPGLHQVDMEYFVGEESELWKKCFGPLKAGEAVTLNDLT